MNSLKMTEKEFALWCLAQSLVPLVPTNEQLVAVAGVIGIERNALIEQYNKAKGV
jgi:hypothetical protein